MDQAKLLRRIRRATLLLAAAGALYLYTRFELLTLPEAGCTPVLRYTPGSSLLLDTRPRPLQPGDGVVFDAGNGSTSIALVRELREDGAAWLVTDAPDCPAADSDALGWIPADRLLARVVFAAAW